METNRSIFSPLTRAYMCALVYIFSVRVPLTISDVSLGVSRRDAMRDFNWTNGNGINASTIAVCDLV